MEDGSTLSLLTPYPINSIYMAESEASPASIFGGEWERIEKKFLLGHGTGNTLGQVGGEESHQLTVDEMPGHDHTPSLSKSRFLITDGNGLGRLAASQDLPGGIITVSWDEWATGRTGGDQPHNNMPPYYVVNIWKRVA